MEERKKEERNKKDLIVKIVLIIIIIVLLIHNCVMLNKTKKEDVKTPTGNVDIFEIQCNKKECTQIEPVGPTEPEDPEVVDPVTGNDENNTEKNNDGKVNNNNNNNNNSNNNNNNNNNNDDKNDGEVKVIDNQVEWESTNNLRIFSNPVYNFEQKIAPESSNVYQFVVKNNTKYKVKYEIKFIEENPYNINMRYKLKKNDKYVISEYVTYSELMQKNIEVEKNSNDTYYLEWKWISSENDTEVGNNLSSNYKLKIVIKAESI